MTESTAEPWIALLAEAPPVALLPVVRIVRAAGACSFDGAREVLAIHADRLLAFRVRRSKPLPAALFEPGSVEAWRTPPPLKPHADLALQQIAQASITGPAIYGHRWLLGRERGYHLRVVTTDDSFFEMRLPEDDAQAVIVALRALLGGRLAEVAELPSLPPNARRLLPAPHSPWLRGLVGIAAFAGPGFLIAVQSGGARLESWLGVPSFLALILVLIFSGLIVIRALRNRHSAYAEKERAALRRAKRRTRSAHAGREPLRSFWLGGLLKALGIVAFFTAFVTALLVPLWLPIHHFDSVLQALAYVPATLLIYYGYRLSLRTASEVRQGDTRPPILYLRSFGLDGRTNLNPPGFIAQSLGLETPWLLRWLGPVGNIYPIRLVRLCLSRAADHAEEQLATFFQRLGPFIAIGRPGDRLAIGGAARVYLEDADWRAAVQRLMDEAQVIVIQPDDTEQMWWEIRETFQRTKLENVLFLLLSCEGAQWKYERFRLQFEHETGRMLPRALGDGIFLHFTPAGPRLQPVCHLPHIVWPVAGCAVDFRRTLAPFLAAREGRTAPVASVPPVHVRAFSALAALGIWTLAIGAVYGLASLPVHQSRLRLETRAMLREAAAESGRTVLQIPVQESNRLVVVPGPTLPPYTVALPRSWAPLKVKRSLAEIVSGSRQNELLWGFGDLVDCLIRVDPEAEPPLKTSEEYTAQILAELQRKMRSVSVLSESTEQHDGRAWHTTRLRTIGGGRLAQMEDMERGVFIVPDQERLTTLRTYVGPHGMMQFRTTALASMPREVEPVLAQIFATFHYESRAQRAEVARLAEVAATTALERRQADQLLPGLNLRTHSGVRLGYTLTLGENWEPVAERGGLDRLFLLHDQAVFGVEIIDLAKFPTRPTPELLADSLVAGLRIPDAEFFEIQDRTSLTAGGLRWERIRYRQQTRGRHQLFTSWITVAPGGGLHLVGWTTFHTTEAHDSILDPVFRRFKLGP